MTRFSRGAEPVVAVGWNRRLTESDRAEIKRLYVEEGKTAKVVAVLFGVSVTLVHRTLSDLGVQMRKRGDRGDGS